jgi:hypothetical protein
VSQEICFITRLTRTEVEGPCLPRDDVRDAPEDEVNPKRLSAFGTGDIAWPTRAEVEGPCLSRNDVRNAPEDEANPKWHPRFPYGRQAGFLLVPKLYFGNEKNSAFPLLHV